MMQRRASNNTNSTNLLDPETASTGSVTKGNRKSMTARLANRPLDEETSSKIFPFTIMLMEVAYFFVDGSCEVYSIYSLAGFTSVLVQQEAIEGIIKFRHIGTLAVLPIGIFCDSYINIFIPLMVLILILTAFIGLQAFLTIPSAILTNETEVSLARMMFPIFFLLYVSKPLKLVTVIRAVVRGYYFRDDRQFYAILVCAMHLGTALGGTVSYFAMPSRYALCIVMFANFSIMVMYSTFYLVGRSRFITDKSCCRPLQNYAVIEKATAAIVCYFFKYFDTYIMRKWILGEKSYEHRGDYRCFTFSLNTLTNARTLFEVFIILSSLFTAFNTFVLLDLVYYIQLSSFNYYPHDPFPLLAIKGYAFLILFPILEIYVYPALKNCWQTESSRLLLMVGVGSLCASMALAWTFGVQKMLVDGNEFWYSPESKVANIKITNCINEPIEIRSQYLNFIMDDDEEWTTLSPLKTITTLSVDAKTVHFEYTNDKLGLYDEYFLPLQDHNGTWYLILPNGIFPLPQGCFQMDLEAIVLTSLFFDPGRVCVVCALTICTGYVRFSNEQGETYVPIKALSGRGDIKALKHEKIVTWISGNTTISTLIGGSVTGEVIVDDFIHAESYMVIVYDTLVTAGKKTDEAQQDFIGLKVIKTSPTNWKRHQWMYPTVICHALAEVIYQVSLWMFLFNRSPDQIRTTVFCFPYFLCALAYGYFHLKGTSALRLQTPMAYLYFAAINCFFAIIYFFSILFFMHKCKKRAVGETPNPRVTVSRLNLAE